MTRETRSAEEIQEYVRLRLHENREVQEDEATIKVPLPHRSEPDAGGSNWSMNYFGGDANGYNDLINAVIAEARRKFNLRE